MFVSRFENVTAVQNNNDGGGGGGGDDDDDKALWTMISARESQQRCELFDFFYDDWPVWTHTLNCVWSDEKINKRTEPKWTQKNQPNYEMGSRCFQNKPFRCNKLIKHVYMSREMKRKLRTQTTANVKQKKNDE